MLIHNRNYFSYQFRDQLYIFETILVTNDF